MKKLSFIIFFFVLCGATGIRELSAAENTGLIYDIQGNAEKRSVDGKTTILKRNLHLLLSVKEGDILKVGSGRIVIVFAKDNVGYEIGSNSEGVVKNKRILPVRGTVKEMKGLHPPNEGVQGLIGGLVMRKGRPCVIAHSPVNTAILTLTPQLVWENNCPDAQEVVIKIISQNSVVFSMQTSANSVKIPAGILKYGAEYQWIIESKRMTGFPGGKFSILDETQATQVNDDIMLFKQQENDPSYRLSLIFFLLDKNLKEMARDEIMKFTKEYSENTSFKELMEMTR
jgi:hypothetical protein